MSARRRSDFRRESLGSDGGQIGVLKRCAPAYSLSSLRGFSRVHCRRARTDSYSEVARCGSGTVGLVGVESVQCGWWVWCAVDGRLDGDGVLVAGAQAPASGRAADTEIAVW